VKITITNLQNKIRISQRLISSSAKIILSAENCPQKRLSLTISTDKKIRELNRRFLGKDCATDVLAFSFVEGKLSKINPYSLLGDVIVSADTAFSNAEIYKTSPREELILYIIHGILHLLGYDDITPAKRRLMRKKERYYLRKLKIEN